MFQSISNEPSSIGVAADSWPRSRLPVKASCANYGRFVMAAFAMTVGCHQSPPPSSPKPLTTAPLSSSDSQTSRVSPETATSDPQVEGSSQRASEPIVMHALPEFALTDQTGSAFGSSDLKGYVWVANFMFTRCQATCPRQTERFAALQQKLAAWPDQSQVRLVSFTVDPESDTVQQLREYAERHGADEQRWRFLTGPRRELWNLSKEGFKLPVSEAAATASSPITHSPLFVLVDRLHRVRGFYDGLSDDGFRKLTAGLRAVLSAPSEDPEQTIHVPMPKDLFETAWLDQKQADQLAAADRIRTYHDFTFVDAIESSGIRFVSRAVADAAKDFKKNHYDHANGIAVADVDGDGLIDLYLQSQVGGNELWKNLGGGQFENITQRAGVGLGSRVCVSASFADTDNDGDPDLFVTTTRHGNVLFENLGNAKFVDISERAGLNYVGHSSTGEFFDFDRDGRLDLLVTNVGRFTTDEIGYSDHPDQQDHPYFVGQQDSFVDHMFPERYERSILYRNEGENRFKNVSDDVGFLEPLWSGDATPLDANDDGWTDFYLANMQGEDEYYENIDGLRFEKKQRMSFPVPVWGGMCVKSFDYNNDGLMDLFVTNMHADMWSPARTVIGAQEKQKTPRDRFTKSYLRTAESARIILGNGLYRKTGKGEFQEVSDQVNAENYWPWGHSVGDLNADGFPDLFITSSMNLPFRYQTNSVLLNDQGKTFVDAEFVLGIEPRAGGKVGAPWFELDCRGPDAEHPMAQGHRGKIVVWAALGSRSSVLFDLDQDGDLDIVTNDFNSAPQILISNLSERNPGLRFLQIQLQGVRANRDGLGAKVQVSAAGKTYTQVNDGQSGYLSQSSMPLYFGLATANTIDRIIIDWPSGTHQELTGPIPSNQLLKIVEAD